MRVTVPTWTLVVPGVLALVWLWMFWMGRAWDRWVTPWIMHRWAKMYAEKNGLDEAYVRQLVDDHQFIIERERFERKAGKG